MFYLPSIHLPTFNFSLEYKNIMKEIIFPLNEQFYERIASSERLNKNKTIKQPVMLVGSTEESFENKRT